MSGQNVSVKVRVVVEPVGDARRVTVKGHGLTRATAQALAYVWIDGRTARSIPPEVENDDFTGLAVHRWTTTNDDYVLWSALLDRDRRLREAADWLDAAVQTWRRMGAVWGVTHAEVGEAREAHRLSSADVLEAAELVGLRPLTSEEQREHQGLALILDVVT